MRSLLLFVAGLILLSFTLVGLGLILVQILPSQESSTISIPPEKMQLAVPILTLTPSSNLSTIKLTVNRQDGASTFSHAGEIINYTYTVQNTVATPLGEPIVISDGTKLVTCPSLKTVGNLDDYLDLNETLTCTSSYTITQADVTTGSVTNVVTATVGGVASNQNGITLTLGSAQPSSVLKLTKTSSSQTYGQAGESITYTFVITNTGTTPLGPAQFTITDSKLGALNCGPTDTTLAPNQSISCSAPYTITQADVNLVNLTNTATAAGAGQTSATASITIANLVAQATQIPPTATPMSNLTPGSTIQHQVAVGEWLLQIARCYGAKYSDVRSANPQIRNPDLILPAMTITVPRIGSAGKIYGPPCVSFYTAQGGDTWAAIAQRYNADINILQQVNRVPLSAGTVIKVPLNSAANTITPTAYVPTISIPVTPLVPSTPAPPSSAVIRILIPVGTTTATQIGILNPNDILRYVVNVAAGQTLSIKLTAPANEVAVGVNDPTGLPLKPLDANLTWSTTVTKGGDYTITVASLTGSSSKDFALEVTVTKQEAQPSAGPKLVVQSEWPRRLYVGVNGTIKISLIWTSATNYVPTLVVTDNTASVSTAIPMPTAIGTQSVGIDQVFGKDYQAFVIPSLSGSTFNYDPKIAPPKPLSWSRVDWTWSINSDKKGKQTVNVAIGIDWQRKDGRGGIIPGYDIWDPEPLQIEVIQPWIELGTLSVSTLIGGLLGSVLSVPFLYDLYKARRQQTQPKPKPRNR